MRIGVRKRIAGDFLFAAALLCVCAAHAHAAIAISRSPTKNINCANGVCEPTAKDAVLNIVALENLLAAGNVRIVSTGDGVQSGDILVRSAFSWTTTNTLDLDAYRSVFINAHISIRGMGGLSLETNDGGSGGMLLFGDTGHVAFSALSSSLTINAESFALVNTISALAAAIDTDPAGNYAFADSYDARHEGQYGSSPIQPAFAGTFEGLGNKISNLSMKVAVNDANVGLFADIAAGGTVANLALANLHVSAVGNMQTIGGLAGTNLGLLLGDRVTGRVVARSRSSVGGLVGNNSNQGGSVLDCQSAASVSAATGSQAGTLAGVNGGMVTDSSGMGAVSLTGKSTLGGGLVGNNIGLGQIRRSYAVGEVVGAVFSGGLAGSNDGNIYDSYATGSVEGEFVPNDGYGAAGGLVGFNSNAITDSYSTGAVGRGTGKNVGGLVGVDLGMGAISNSYWDTDTSGITDLGQGAGNIVDDTGITGLTTAQLQSGLPAGFRPSVWSENSQIEDGLPYLLENPPS